MVSHVACIGKLRHKDIGYSGPLSRELLSYRSLISTLRSTLRELMEVIVVGMLLSGEVVRGTWSNDIEGFQIDGDYTKRYNYDIFTER